MESSDNSLDTRTEFEKRYALVAEQNAPMRFIFYNKDTDEYQNILKFSDDFFEQQSTPQQMINNIPEAYQEFLKHLPTINFYDSTMIILIGLFNAIGNRDLDDEQLQTFSQNLIVAVNSFLEDNGFKPEFQSIDTLQELINEWDTNVLAQNIAEDVEKNKQLEATIAELNAIEPLDFSEVNYSGMQVNLEMSINTSVIPLVTPERGNEIFNAIVPDRYIPFIQYNSKEGSMALYKLYETSPVEQPLNYNVIIASNPSNEHTMYFRYWNEDISPLELTKITNVSYGYGKFSLKTSKISVSIVLDQSRDESTVESYINQVFQNLKVDKRQEQYLSGDFNIYDIRIDPKVFLYMVTNDAMFGNYVYINEAETPFADKNSLKLRFKAGDIVLPDIEKKTKASDTFFGNSAKTLNIDPTTLNIRQETADRDMVAEDGSVIPSGTSYININITRASSRKSIATVRNIMARLLFRYKEAEGEISNLYNQFLSKIPSFGASLEESESQGSPSKTKSKRKLKDLQRKAPDVFVKGYSTDCVGAKQPIIVDPNSIGEWEAQEFEYKGNKETRTVSEFPYGVDNPKFHFVCPSNEYPFPAYIDNKHENSSKYQFLPCCAKSKGKMIPNEFSGPTPLKSTKRAITTHKLPDPDSVAKLPKLLSDTLIQVLGITDDQENEVQRYGVPINNNSFIHAVLSALDDHYNQIKSISGKVKYAESFRAKLAFNPSLVKQELYDISEAEISEYAHSNAIYFDSKLFYRILEEHFAINIYVFYLDTRVDDVTNIMMEIPRNSKFYIRNNRRRRDALMIYKSWGSDSDQLKNPHNELIILKQGKKNQIKRFSTDINERLYQIFVESQSIYTVNTEPDSGSDVDIVIHKDLYYAMNFSNLVKLKNQYLDESGKARAFICTLKKDETREFTIIVPPSQPENLPTFDKNDNKRLTFKEALDLFGNPNACNLDERGEIAGLWFPILDLLNGIYVPITFDNGDLADPEYRLIRAAVGPVPFVLGPYENKSRINKMKRDLDIFEQLLSWLFLSNQPLATAESFAKRYFHVNANTIATDSSTFYNFSNISSMPQILPDFKSTDVAIKYLIDNGLGNMFVQQKIRMYPRGNFVEYFVSRLKQLYLIAKSSPDLEKPSALLRIFQTEQDYVSRAHVRIFEGDSKLMRWLEGTETLLQIKTRLEINDLRGTDFFIYKDDRFYIVQPVIGSDKLRALQVALIWRDQNINMGYKNSDQQVEETVAYVIYNVSPAGKLQAAVNHSDASSNYLQILAYDINRYVALLPLN
jgi:hypothetical protein